MDTLPQLLALLPWIFPSLPGAPWDPSHLNNVSPVLVSRSASGDLPHPLPHLLGVERCCSWSHPTALALSGANGI